MVSIRTARFNTQNSAFYHTVYLSVQYVFCNKLPPFPYAAFTNWSFHWKHCVPCAVRMNHKNSKFWYSKVVPRLSRLAADLSPWKQRLRSQASPFEICASRSGNRTDFSTSVSFFCCYFQPSSDPYLYSSTC